jgi:heat shock protein HslJ/uncharacterized membrane protein
MKFTWILLISIIFTACKSKQKISQRKDDVSSQVISEEEDGIRKFKFLQQKFQKDVQFYATGNEPFWSLDMNFTLFMNFDMMDSLEIQTAAGRPQAAPDGISTLYRAASEKGELIVSIIPQECIDNMSGEIFTHEVAVRARVSPESPYTEVRGCGRYVPDFRLHNVWMLHAIDGTEIKNDSLVNKIPTLEINLEKSAVAGFAGCNQYHGYFSHEGNNINFGELVSTKMYCPSMELEQRFLSVLRGQSYSYVVSNNGNLKLMNGEHSLVFRLKR